MYKPCNKSLVRRIEIFTKTHSRITSPEGNYH
jgi:hypothetical protein